MHVQIEKINGETLDYKFKKKSVKIGRSKSCEIILVEDGISREHLQIDAEFDQIYLIDLESTNGVMLNDERIPNRAKVLYMDIFEIELPSGTKVHITLDDGVQDKVSRPSIGGVSTGSSKKNNGKDKIDTKKKKVKAPAKRSSSKSGNRSNLTSVLLLIILIGGGFYLYTEMFDSSPSIEPVVINTNKRANKPKKVIKRAKPFKPQKDYSSKLREMVKGNLCDKKSLNFCNMVKLDQSKQEGAYISNNILYVFVNLTHRLNTDYNNISYISFKKLNTSKKNYGILSKNIFNMKLFNQAKRLKLSDVRIYGHILDQGIIDFQNGIIVNIYKKFKVNDIDISKIMDHYLLKGNDKFFTFYLKKYTKLIDFNH